ncbi:hypothetical protein [Microbacterium thalli]|uniref:hypothetical protein n=1 Tax=Microbacterium thalli TaxID=3027921 RepID=UPI0023672353|nr:hypothetical protein [Microbacterium thalli]MDD7929185.1 hypothetical protein [Microbacterium thalli]
MDRPGGAHARRLRAGRGAGSAAIATVLAATAHTLSGGLAPLWLIAAAALLATPVSVWLVGRTPSSGRTALVVLASQGLFHTFFSIAGSANPGAASAHLHPGSQLALAAGSHAHAASPSMTATHVAAAALTILALVVGERAIGAIARGIRRVERLLSPVAPVPALLRLTPDRRRRFVVARPVRSFLSLRGPPVATA